MTGRKPAPGPESPALPLAEAARALGLSDEALRMRLRRGRIAGYKGGDGRLYVHLPRAAIEAQAAHEARPGLEAAALMAAEITDLRKRLDEAERAQAELRRLLLQAQQTLGALVDAAAERRPLPGAGPAASASAPLAPPWASLMWPWLMLAGAWPPRQDGH